MKIRELVDSLAVADKGPERGGKRHSGRTLIELLVSIIVIGLLSTIALTYMGDWRVRTLSSESKQILGELRRFEEVYFVEHGSYADSVEKLGFTQPPGSVYSYTIESASEADCVIRADGIVGTDVENEVWKLEITNRVANQPAKEP